MQCTNSMNIYLQTPKIIVFRIVFKLILRSLKENILTSFIALLKNLLEIIAIDINNKSIITLTLTRFIQLLY